SQAVSFSEFYDKNIIFQDPIHRIESLELLVAYFKKLNQNLASGNFQFTSMRVTKNIAYLEWMMNVELRKPNKKISASGISVVTFEDKITHHRDYFDAGELFYENIPLVGGLIRFLKKKIAM
ncbi:MAG: nuclear transport factor 2 family protein, partial [Flammeovirgaceae bacterium]